MHQVEQSAESGVSFICFALSKAINVTLMAFLFQREDATKT
jgi:hypothetical protein